MASTVFASHQPGRPRLLAIAERLPRPDESSGSCRFLAILTQLARIAHVDLWVELDESEGSTPLPVPRVAADRQRLENLGVRVLPCTWRAFRRAMATERYDTVFFEFYHVAARYLPVVRHEQREAALVVDSVDLHFSRLQAGVAIGTVDPAWAREVHLAETATYRAADGVVVVSTEEASVLGREPGMPAIVCVPNCVTIRPRVPQTREAEAVFVGHFHHAPNLDGLTWFVREAWPRVRQRHPDARLTVIGSYPSAAVHALGDVPGVVVLGYVPDLEPHLDRAAAAIAPLRFGAGMKGKVTDALAAGLPVVTTPIGAQGLDLVHGRHAWVAGDPDAFADALADVFDDPVGAAAVGGAGQNYISQVCGPDAIAASLDTLVQLPRRASRATDGMTAPGRRLLLARMALGYWRTTRARRFAAWLAPRRAGLAGEAAQHT